MSNTPLQNFIPCKNHPNKIAKKYCGESKCEGFYCNSCVLSFHKDHIEKLQEINKMYTQNSEHFKKVVQHFERSELKGTIFKCMNFVFHEATDFCNNCGDFVCKKCIDKHHAGHSFTTLKNYLQTIENTAKLMIAMINFDKSDLNLNFDITPLNYEKTNEEMLKFIYDTSEIKFGLNDIVKNRNCFMLNYMDKLHKFIIQKQTIIFNNKEVMDSLAKEFNISQFEKDKKKLFKSYLGYQKILSCFFSSEEEQKIICSLYANISNVKKKINQLNESFVNNCNKKIEETVKASNIVPNLKDFIKKEETTFKSEMCKLLQITEEQFNKFYDTTILRKECPKYEELEGARPRLIEKFKYTGSSGFTQPAQQQPAPIQTVSNNASNAKAQQMMEEAQKKMDEVRIKETSLSQKEQNLNEREKEINEKQKQLDAILKQLESKQKEFEERERLLQQSEENLRNKLSRQPSSGSLNPPPSPSTPKAQPIKVVLDSKHIQSFFDSSFSKANKNLEEKLEEYNKKLEESLSQILAQNEINRTKQIQQQMDELSSIKTQLITSNSAAVSSANVNSANMSATNAGALEQMNNLQNQLMNVTLQISDKKVELTQLEGQINQKQMEISIKDEELTKKTNLLTQKEQDVYTKEQEINQKTQNIFELNRELDKLKSSIEEEKNKYNTLLNNIDSSSKDLNQLHSQISQANNEYNSIKANTAQISQTKNITSNPYTALPNNQRKIEETTTTNNNVTEYTNNNNYANNKVEKPEQEQIPEIKTSIDEQIENIQEKYQSYPEYNESVPVYNTEEQPEPQQEEDEQFHPLEQFQKQQEEAAKQEQQQQLEEEEDDNEPDVEGDPENPTLPMIKKKLKLIKKNLDEGASNEQVQEQLQALSWPERNLIEMYAIGQIEKTILIFNPFFSDAEEIEIDFQFPSFNSFVNVSPYLYLTGGKYENESSPSSNKVIRFRRTGDKEFSNEELAPMKDARKYHSSVYAPYFNEIVVVGGTKMKACERYKIESNEWTELPNLLSSREKASCCIYNETFLYVFFGFDRSKSHYVTTIEKLDLNDPMSFEAVSIPGNQNILKKQSFSVIYNKEEGEVLIVGGLNASRKICKEIVEYKFGENIANLSSSSLPLSASFIQGQFLSMFDGYSYVFAENTVVMKFDPKVKEFSKIE